MSRQQQDAIESPGGWLTTVASRICLDLLGSARARRERYVGECAGAVTRHTKGRGEGLDRTLQTEYSIHICFADAGTGPAAGGGPAPGPDRSVWSSS